MNETVRVIIEKLNQEPFNKSFNNASFGSLSSEQLLQLLDTVLSDIQPNYGCDLTSSDDTTDRTVAFLRLLNYPQMAEVEQFGERLVDRALLYHLLEWCLTRTGDLKKRVYLAHYLLKIDCPTDMLADREVADTYQQYELLMDEFKQCHKECDTLRQWSTQTDELRRDLASIQQERDTVANKIQRLKSKVEGQPELLELSRRHRQQRQLQQQLASQRQQQLHEIEQLQQQLELQQPQLQQLHTSGETTPEGLIRQLDKQVEIYQSLADEKLPRQLLAIGQQLSCLQQAAGGRFAGAADLQPLRNKVAAAMAELQQLEAAGGGGGGGSSNSAQQSHPEQLQELAVFRQQAAVMAAKKEQTAAVVSSMQQQLQQLRHSISRRRESRVSRPASGVGHASAAAADTSLVSAQYRNYIEQLHQTSAVYRQRRAELDQLEKELQLLTDQQLLPADSAELLNVSRPESGEAAGESVSAEVTPHLSGDIVRQIEQLKMRMAPMVTDLRVLRQRYQQVIDEYTLKRQQYDSVTAGLETANYQLSLEVEELCRRLAETESGTALLTLQLRVLAARKQLLQHEPVELAAAAAADSGGGGDGVVFSHQLQSLISSGERENDQLKTRQRELRETGAETAHQHRMWTGIMRFLELKRSCAAAAAADARDQVFQRGAAGERLQL